MRYKDFRLLRKEEIQKRALDVEDGNVTDIESLKEFGAFLGRDEGLYSWWRVHMGFQKEEGDEG